MPNVTLYHNPRCSKSRETLKLLQDNHIEPTIIEYLKSPPSTKALKSLIQQLEITPRQLLRTKESLYKEIGLDQPEVTDEKIISAMHDNPVLIERPIVVNHDNQRAAIGRPPEAILNIL